MAIPENESIQESLDRLSEEQSKATDSPAADRPPRDRDTRVLGTILGVWPLSLVAILILTPWADWPYQNDGAPWLCTVALVCVLAAVTTFVVTSVAWVPLLVLNPRRFLRAWKGFWKRDPDEPPFPYSGFV
ncbi:hypothetical protein [Longivirga aurantiaca]|uniref:Uncharacterized protein n=1 Tax=Longivirga aurantiaca TaxID=1837743 RepID=A0ABW1T1Z2_9ACTN